MTKLRTPMATDRISTELTRAAGVLFPLAFQEPTRRGAKQVAIFTEAAEAILDLINEPPRSPAIEAALQTAKKYVDNAELTRLLTERDKLSRDNLDENGGGNQSLKRRPVAEL
jgi:hypothetical protein